MKPTFIYDSDDSWSSREAEKIKALDTEQRITFLSTAEIHDGQFSLRDRQAFRREIHFVDADGVLFRGAHMLPRLWSHLPKRRKWVPLVRPTGVIWFADLLHNRRARRRYMGR